MIKIEAVSDSPVNKSLTTDTLQEQFKNNKEKISSNMSSTKDLLGEASKLARALTAYYSNTKSKLTELEQNIVGENLGINSTRHDKDTAETSEVDKAFSNITKGKKLMTDSMYRINTLQESLPQGKSTITRENYLNNAEDTIKKKKNSIVYLTTYTTY